MVAQQKLILLALAAIAAAQPTGIPELVAVSGYFAGLTVGSQAYSGGVFNALTGSFPFLSQLNSSFAKVPDLIKGDTAYTTAQAQIVLDTANKYLEPNVKNAVAATQSKKSLYTSSGLKASIHGYFQDYQDYTRFVYGNYSSKFPSSQKGSLDNAFWKVISDLQTGIDDFGS